MQIIIDTLGWIGTVMYLVAYALVSLKKVEADSLGRKYLHSAALLSKPQALFPADGEVQKVYLLMRQAVVQNRHVA